MVRTAGHASGPSGVRLRNPVRDPRVPVEVWVTGVGMARRGPTAPVAGPGASGSRAGDRSDQGVTSVSGVARDLVASAALGRAWRALGLPERPGGSSARGALEPSSCRSWCRRPPCPEPCIHKRGTSCLHLPPIPMECPIGLQTFGRDGVPRSSHGSIVLTSNLTARGRSSPRLTAPAR